MKIVMCDNHPDRKADYTFSIRTLPLGCRPLFAAFGDSSKPKYLDLCVECKSKIFPGETNA